MDGSAYCFGAATIINGIALGKGAAYGIKLKTTAKVTLTSEPGIFEVKIKGDQQIFTSLLEERGFEWREAENDILRVALPDEIEPEVFFRMAVENGMQIRHLVATRHSLEDVFAQAVEGE